MAYYDWIKAIHVIAVIAWMAGLFYLPRLFVYHTRAEPGSVQSETFKAMERRLHRGIMNPAMALAWLAGLTLAWTGGWVYAGWFVAKFVLVVAMTGFDFWLGRCRRAFAEDRNQVAERTYRLANELPTVLLIAIVILVVVKPF